ncbi:MAG: hypothetical protein JRN62_02590 [Nitrososphaerota archaeon]|jgi:hypothetical protein|nr:hypothetical protein [Nitrososphaerota archaeon]MDG6948890.1 hypothetical protein [Nitrososphaerota archaeon]
MSQQDFDVEMSTEDFEFSRLARYLYQSKRVKVTSPPNVASTLTNGHMGGSKIYTWEDIPAVMNALKSQTKAYMKFLKATYKHDKEKAKVEAEYVAKISTSQL